MRYIRYHAASDALWLSCFDIQGGELTEQYHKMGVSCNPDIQTKQIGDVGSLARLKCIRLDELSTAWLRALVAKLDAGVCRFQNTRVEQGVRAEFTRREVENGERAAGKEAEQGFYLIANTRTDGKNPCGNAELALPPRAVFPKSEYTRAKVETICAGFAAKHPGDTFAVLETLSAFAMPKPAAVKVW